MQLLLTGGLGFIGSISFRYILNKRQIYSDQSGRVTYAGHPENLADIKSNANYKFMKGSIEDTPIVDSIVSGERFGPIDGI